MDSSNDSVYENIKKIQTQISEAEKKYARKEGSVKLLAVSKFHPKEAVLSAIKAGQYCFGENRVQEAVSKFPEIIQENPQVQLHIIGQLQSNKVKKAVEIASVIESVDRLELVQEIEKHCSKIEKNIQILLEFHTAEDSKSGYSTINDIKDTLSYIANGNAPHVIPTGFMTMAPFTEDENLIRKSFALMRETKEKLQCDFPQFSLKELSMGMTHDFEIAIQEGSTQVRVGTAIFGERVYS